MNGNEADLLRGLAPDDLEQILLLGSSIGVSAGEVVFGLGDEAGSVYLVEEGKVDLTLPLVVAGKQEDVPVEERVPGQMLGWSGLVPPYRFTLKATAMAETRLRAIPREDLLAFFADRPQIGLAVMTNLAAIVGHRFQVFQAMWLRQVQRAVESRDA